jgi:type I restriction enzyme S subunit
MAVKPGFKQTLVGAIPEDWEVSQLGALAETSSGTTPARALNERYFKNGSIAWVKTMDLTNSEIFVTSESITELAIKETCLRLYPVGTVLVAMYGGFQQIGRTGLLRTSASVNQAITAVQPKTDRLVSEYLIETLNYRVDYWKSVASSSRKDPNISSQDIRNFPIAYPRPPEQRAIAEALSDMDALLGALERLIAKKRDLKQAVMQQLLTGQIRLPGFLGEWVVKRLGDVARIQRGASPRPIDSPVWFDQNSSVGWVRISDVTKSGMYLRETTQRLSPLGVQYSRPVARGSLIMSICATVGRPVVTEIDVCIHDGFVVFDDLQADKLFIYYTLKWIEPNWSKHGQTGSQMNLNTGLITGTEVSLPPLPEQTAIAAVLTDMDAELTALEQRLAKTRTLKQGMMQELLTGRTRLL